MTNNIKTLSINLSEDAAIKALSKLSNMGLDPTPDLYSIWYSYYKGDDCDLKLKMDKIIQENPGISEECISFLDFGKKTKNGSENQYLLVLIFL